MLTEDLGEYLRLYDLWSQWKPEEPEGILIAHASIHGNTAHAAKTLKSKLRAKVRQVTICVSDGNRPFLRCCQCILLREVGLASSTYDGGLFPPMREFWNIYGQRDSETAGLALLKTALGHLLPRG